MYAVVKTGGKQYRVAPGAVLRVERLAGEAGTTVLLDQVLLLAEGEKVTLGTPFVDGAVVKAEILEQTRAPKIVVFKKKRRHNYRRKRGHRQHVTVLKVLEIGRKGAGEAKTKAGEAAAKATPAKTKPGAEAKKKTTAKSAGKSVKAKAAASEKKASAAKTAAGQSKKTASTKKAAKDKSE